MRRPRKRYLRDRRRHLVVATYLRGKNSGYLYFIDIDSWKIKEEKTIAANISPGSSSNSGITYLNGYIYFTGADETEFTSAMHTTLSRYSVETGRVEKDIVDFKADEPMANLVDCGVVATGSRATSTWQHRTHGGKALYRSRPYWFTTATATPRSW